MSASSADQSVLSVYAAERDSDGALTAVVVNKTAGGLVSQVSLSGFAPGGPAQVWRYSTANLRAIVREADIPIGVTAAATFPANSITLLVVPREQSHTPRRHLPRAG